MYNGSLVHTVYIVCPVCYPLIRDWLPNLDVTERIGNRFSLFLIFKRPDHIISIIILAYPLLASKMFLEEIRSNKKV